MPGLRGRESGHPSQLTSSLAILRQAGRLGFSHVRIRGFVSATPTPGSAAFRLLDSGREVSILATELAQLRQLSESGWGLAITYVDRPRKVGTTSHVEG
jgi:hypothetical protein